MKKTIYNLILVSMIFGLGSCLKVTPDGPPVSEERAVGAFSRIEATFSADVVFEQSGTQKVVVEAAKNIQNYIVTEVVGDKLVLKTRPNVLIRHGYVKVYVSNPNLTGVTLTGSGDFTANTDITTDGLNLKFTGSGDMHFPKSVTARSVSISATGSGGLEISSLDADDINSEQTGSGDVRIDDGANTNQKIRITGSGDYNSSGMQSEFVKATLTGSGSVRVRANQTLEVAISGSGGVRYSGNPSVDVSISGSGRVARL